MDKTGFFEEAPGDRSANRLIFIIGYFWLMATTTMIILLKSFKGLEVGWTEITVYFSTIAGILAGLKLGQKAMEKTTSKQPKI